MATKSDFAQKLLQDLRTRKERMASGQNSSRQSSQSSRVMQGNHGQTSRGTQHINALESAGSRTGKTSRGISNGGNSRSINSNESSNQIVLYENGSRQVRDLSMAIAYAFEKCGNLSKTGSSSSNNPLVNFFNRFGRRSMDCRKMDITTAFSNHSQSPNVSHIHITEISKGVQKLNQILRACSNGYSLDRNSIEVGKELLRGAIDLEESLRMLANLQESSQYVNGAQKKSHLKLLDEDDDDDQEDNDKTAKEWKVDRPNFSFDKPSRNSHVVQSSQRRQQLALPYQEGNSEQPISDSRLVAHRRSTSYVQDLSFSTQVKVSSYSRSPQSTQEKGRLTNVIAKLMGLEELSHNEDSMSMKNDLKGNQGKVSRNSTKLPETLNRESRNESNQSTNKKVTAINITPPIRDSKLQLKGEKSRKTKDGGIKMVSSERNKPQKDENKLQQSHTISANQVNSHQRSEDGERQQNLTEDKKSRINESESKVLALNIEQQQKGQNGRTLKAEERTHNRIGNKVSTNSMVLREQVAEGKGQQFKKQDFVAKNQLESTIALKSKRVTPTNLQKLSSDKSARGNGRSKKPNEKVLVKDPPNKKHQDVAPMINISDEARFDKGSFKKEEEEQQHHKSTGDPQFDTENENSNGDEKLIEVSATQKRDILRKIQRSEIPQKIDVLITRRNATVNHLKRSMKHPTTMLKDLKQQMQNKNRASKRMEEQNDSKVKETKAGISVYNESEMSTETEKLQNEDVQNISVNSFTANGSQLSQNTPTPKNNCDVALLNSTKVSDDFQTVEQPYDLKDEQDLKQCDQVIGDHEESTAQQNLYQQYKQEQLTEGEKELKEIVIKSQLFLSTAEALFKLNIPVSFLHAGYHDGEVPEKKLVLDSAYEVMKRKAMRHEVTYHPYTKTNISCTKMRSLDDLVKQLCRDLEMLKFYGGNGSDECDVAECLHKMLGKDIYNKDPDVNTMWDFEWNDIMSVFHEKDGVVRDVERHMLNGLLDEILNDLLIITVSV